MEGTRQLLRFRGITYLGYFVQTLLGIATNTGLRVLAHRTDAVRAVTTAVGLPGHPRRRPTVDTTNALTAMVHGADMLDRITIAGNMIRTLHALLANTVATQLPVVICLLWPCFSTSIPARLVTPIVTKSRRPGCSGGRRTWEILVACRARYEGVSGIYGYLCGDARRPDGLGVLAGG